MSVFVCARECALVCVCASGCACVRKRKCVVIIPPLGQFFSGFQCAFVRLGYSTEYSGIV